MKKGCLFGSLSVSTNPRIRCQSCASVLTNSYIRCAPMLLLPRLQGFSITLIDDKDIKQKPFYVFVNNLRLPFRQPPEINQASLSCFGLNRYFR